MTVENISENEEDNRDYFFQEIILHAYISIFKVNSFQAALLLAAQIKVHQ